MSEAEAPAVDNSDDIAAPKSDAEATVKPEVKEEPMPPVEEALSVKVEQLNGEKEEEMKPEIDEQPCSSSNGVPEESEFDRAVAELHKEPLFAEICSFFNYFAGYLAMKPISIVKLEKIFATISEDHVDPELVELHLTLLRKIGLKSVRADRWESFLQKFLALNKADDESLQLERHGYANIPLSTKFDILFLLIGRQFDYNLKFKETIFNTLHTFELRLSPVGKDRCGLSYWFQQDVELNIRLYTEEPDDESGGTWSLIVKSHDDLIQLIESLKRTDFGQVKEENEDDLDESKLLDVDTPTKKKHQNKNAVTRELSPDFWKVLKPEVAAKYYAYLAKRNTFKDVFRDANDVNKKKNEKLQKKEAKAVAAAANQSVTASQASHTKDEDKEDEVEEEVDIPPELLDDRRILPRRNARNTAISNLKNFTATPSRKRPSPDETKKEDSEEESEEDEDGFDEDEESDQSLGSSDEEFNLPGKKSRGKTRRARRPPAEDGDDEPKRKKKKKKVTGIVFEESSDDEEEEEREVKQRKKATEQTLCMQCCKSSHPEVLLLCDMCDDPWHTFCLKPLLWYVPDGDWFCPKCHHAMLVDRLEKIESELCEALKVKEAEETKKRAAAERLKREMEYIGVSLNNVIPSTFKTPMYDSMSESSEEPDDGQRKSKKRALKNMGHRKRDRERYYGPVLTITEGRTRRSTKKVDYNFSAYDEQLQEAMDEPAVKKYEHDQRPSGVGRGKDMANVLDADRKRRLDSDEYEEDIPVRKKKPKQTKRLTDLDLDNATESDESEEYRASDQSEEPEPSEDDYVPSDIERRSRRRSRRDDNDFIDDGSDSDYNPSGRKRKRNSGVRRSGGARKRGWSEDESEENDSFVDDDSDDSYRKKKNKSKSKPPQPRKKRAQIDSEEEEEEDYQSEGESSDGAPRKKTATGRPMRRAAAKAVLKESDDDDDIKEGDAVEEVESKKAKDQRPVGALSRRVKGDEEEVEFKPEEDEEEEEEDDDEEVEIDENEDEEEEQESDDVPDTGEESDSYDTPTMVPKKEKKPAQKTPPKKKAPPPPPAPKKERSPVAPAKEPSLPKAASPVKQRTPSLDKPTSSTAVVAPKNPVSPQRPAPVAVAAPQPMPHPAVPIPHPYVSTPASSAFAPYPPHMSHHGPPTRFAVPSQAYHPPPGAFYGAPAMSYAPPPVLPSYVMQPPPGYPQPAFHNNLTVLEPMQPMHHHMGPPPGAPYSLQPIQLQPPSDSDGLAQAIAGAMNTDL